MKNSAIKGIKSYIEELKEANYSSNKRLNGNKCLKKLYREPLGQGIKRNYKWPEKILNKNFAFGAPTTSGNGLLFEAY